MLKHLISRKLRAYVVLVLLLLASNVFAADVRDLKPTVILISIDGFRYDYFGKAPTPNLDSLIARGVRARYMVPSFPTKTFPNHYTLVTGLYPAHHGIIANTMWDDALHATFKMSDRKQVQDARWWGGEPIWVTAQKAGQKTAPMYWPGSEAAIEGLIPTYWEAWDEKNKTTFEYRVSKVLSWLDLPAPERPTFLTLYFENVDQAGHDFGPDSPQLHAAMERVDQAIGLLLQGLAARRIEDQVNIVVVSDHGMAACSRQRLIMLDDYVDPSNVIVVDTSPVLAAKAKDGNNAALVAKLKLVPHLTVYTPDTVPQRLYYTGNPRITPVIAVADVGWKITSHDYVAKHPDNKYGGDHGYDNAAPEMRAIFVAAGPAFKPHRSLPGFPNVDVYPLLAYLLNVAPASNDGDLRVFKPVLRPKTATGRRLVNR
ncbi:MAG: ectonucleotide pyrophosphatase/phosphodiesterase [Terriglobales bacterium]|jgi:predicted AlkP superfamily pyrophosphatase or phosphodiesterase